MELNLNDLFAERRIIMGMPDNATVEVNLSFNSREDARELFYAVPTSCEDVTATIHGPINVDGVGIWKLNIEFAIKDIKEITDFVSNDSTHEMETYTFKTSNGALLTNLIFENRTTMKSRQMEVLRLAGLINKESEDLK